MVKALFLIDSLGVGGTETQLRALIPRLDRRRIEPYLVCLADETAPSRENLDCKIINLGSGHLTPLEALRDVYRLRRLIADEAINLVIAFFPDTEPIGAFAAWSSGVPIIANRRNIGHWHTPWRLRWIRSVNRFVDHFIANSRAAREVTVEREGVAPNRISVIHNLLALEPLPRDDHINEDGLRICCVANLREVKGHHYLLLAMAELVKSVPNATLDLIGDGVTREQLESDCRTLGIGDAVRFLGATANVGQLLGRYDVGVLPSLAESFPNTVLEYMAAGLPVVATNVGGTPEIVDCSVGRLVPPRDAKALASALLELAADDDLRRSLGDAGRTQVLARFSVPKILEDWHAVLESVAGIGR